MLNSLIFQQKLCKPEGNGRIYLKYGKGKIYDKDYSTQQGSHSKLTDRAKALIASRSKGIQEHQISFTTNAKGTSISRKHKRRKRPTKTNPKQ